MFKPIIQPEKGGWVKVKRIWFSKEPVRGNIKRGVISVSYVFGVPCEPAQGLCEEQGATLFLRIQFR